MTTTAITAAVREVEKRGILRYYCGRGGRGGVYSLHTAIVGGMTPTLIVAAAREVAEKGIL
jgi:hypothetical protein